MLKQVEVLDYYASYAYAPPRKDAVINTDEIISAIPCESRCAEPTMCIRFRDGSHVTAVGKPSDLI